VSERQRANHGLSSGRTVLFVCAHGAARSRLAAAWFNADPPDGWHATTAAGEVPAAALNPRIGALLAGTSAQDHLDAGPPRPLSAVAVGDLVIALDCAVPGADRWSLAATEVDEAMRDELRARVAALTRALAAASPLR
jgi:protein-tyrosine-phosphatase